MAPDSHKVHTADLEHHLLSLNTARLATGSVASDFGEFLLFMACTSIGGASLSPSGHCLGRGSGFPLSASPPHEQPLLWACPQPRGKAFGCSASPAATSASPVAFACAVTCSSGTLLPANPVSFLPSHPRDFRGAQISSDGNNLDLTELWGETRVPETAEHPTKPGTTEMRFSLGLSLGTTGV